MAERDLSDYVEVAERIGDFRKKYPEGCLRGSYQMIQIGEQHLVVFTAYALRDPKDTSPGMGHAWELVPGRTPFTKGSELQNAETSAWGRAIIAVGASDSKRGIASREEVRNRQAEREVERCPGLNGFPCYLDAGHEGTHDSMPRNRDGSLSRSRTTDDQKNAAGVMTSAQQAEHTQLAKPPPNSRRAERVDGPVEDVWMDGPAGLAPVDDPEDRPGTATADQIKTIQTLYAAEFKIGDRDAKIETTRKFLGLDMLSSHTQLSYRQAGDLLLAMRAKLSEKAAR